MWQLFFVLLMVRFKQKSILANELIGDTKVFGY